MCPQQPGTTAAPCYMLFFIKCTPYPAPACVTHVRPTIHLDLGADVVLVLEHARHVGHQHQLLRLERGRNLRAANTAATQKPCVVFACCNCICARATIGYVYVCDYLAAHVKRGRVQGGWPSAWPACALPAQPRIRPSALQAGLHMGPDTGSAECGGRLVARKQHQQPLGRTTALHVMMQMASTTASKCK